MQISVISARRGIARKAMTQRVTGRGVTAQRCARVTARCATTPSRHRAATQIGHQTRHAPSRRELSVKDSDGSRTFRALFISDVHLGTQGLPGRTAARLPARTRRRDDLPGRRHRRRLGAQVRLVLAAAAQRRGAEAAAQGAQGRAHHLRAGQSRRVPARLSTARISAASRWSRTRCTTAPTGGAISSPMATSSISWCTQARWLALLGDKAYDFAIARQPHLQRACAAASASPTGRCRNGPS